MKISKTRGGIITVIGFLLSPLSWWNDIFINIPLAYLFGSLFGLINERLALPMFIVGYWITNILGLYLMHIGVKDFRNGKSDSKKSILYNLGIAVIYSIIVTVMFLTGWIKFPHDYFN